MRIQLLTALLATILHCFAARAADPVVKPSNPDTSQAGATKSDTPKPDTSKVWLLHLPGISGNTGLDEGMLRGLKDGGYDAAVETYDWTGANPGLGALLASKRNHEQAQKIADLIVARVRANPRGRIIITTHSAGAGLWAWALESLPEDVKVDNVLLLSPAVSPTYDLSKALTHVRGKVYAFTSPGDFAILGVATQVLGTIDGKYTVAAGQVGFKRPPGADTAQYDKLVSKPYQRAWLKYDNLGDHVGMMSPPFAAAVLAPIVLNVLPNSAADAIPPDAPTSRPSAHGN